MSEEKCCCCCCQDRAFTDFKGGLHIKNQDIDEESQPKEGDIFLTGGDGNGLDFKQNPIQLTINKDDIKWLNTTPPDIEPEISGKKIVSKAIAEVGKVGVNGYRTEPKKFIMLVEVELMRIIVHVLDMTENTPKRVNINLKQSDSYASKTKELVDVVAQYQPISIFFYQEGTSKAIEDAFRKELDKPHIAMEIDDKNFMTYRF